jgi:ADP-glucose pyrophosphorylase
MQRRKFITLLSGAAASSLSPLAARAQQPTVPVLGQLHYINQSVSRCTFRRRI